MVKSKWRKISILVHNKADPISVALNHTHCPVCQKPLDNEWRCFKDKIRIYFKQEELK